MPTVLKSKIKDWAKGQDGKLSISKAICRLVERGLAGAAVDAQIDANRAAGKARSKTNAKEKRK